MVAGHMPHNKDEAQPWHVVIFYVLGNEVRSCRTDEERSDAGP